MDDDVDLSQLEALVLLTAQGNQIIKVLADIRATLYFTLGFVAALFGQALIR